MRLRIRALYPVPSTGAAVSHISESLCREMSRAGADVSLAVVGFADRRVPRLSEVRYVTPPEWMLKVLYRLGRDPRLWVERKYLSQVHVGDVAWLWPGASDDVYRRLHDAGRLVVNERINCHRATAARILLPEYERLGLPKPARFSQADIEGETHKLRLSDYVFAPSPLVAASLEEAGVPREKILPTSYGWDVQRIQVAPAPRPPRDAPVFLFVGLGCVRKGLHLLLAAWARKPFQGELHIAGRITEEIQSVCGDLLRRDDVKLLGHVHDINEAFARADVFVFPSLEEGGPLVSYEAIAAGLPCVVSPMGAGEVIRDGVEGFIVAPHELDGWLAAMERLATDAALRAEMSRRARERSLAFTWPEVARRRLAQLREVVAKRLAGVGPMLLM